MMDAELHHADEVNTPGAGRTPPWRMVALAVATLAAWVLLYRQLALLADWVTFRLLGLPAGAPKPDMVGQACPCGVPYIAQSPATHLSSAVWFFLYEVPKVLLLLALVVFGVGIIRSFFTPERTRQLLAGRHHLAGNVLSALLGVVTPFCSCSAVPLFIGFVTAGVPLGVTFSFLIAAPMVNEVALLLLLSFVGWKVAVLYLVTGLLIAIIAGWIIGRMKLEGHVEEWVYRMQAGEGADPPAELAWGGRIQYGLAAVRAIVGRVWLFVVLGIAIGAGIHGYVPEGFLARMMGEGAWWAVPVAVLIGIPMYANAAGIVPVAQALLSKGAALGTVLAFMMAVIALSLPEMIILRNVLKPRLIATFVLVVGAGILLVGYLFNLVL